MKKNQNGFSAVEGLLVLVIVGIIGGAGYFVYNSQKNTNDTLDNTAKSNSAVKKSNAKPIETVKPDKNVGYLVVKEWGLRFKVPDGLTEVKYVIKGNTAAFYAKPTGSNVQYRSDYAKFDGESPTYASGILYKKTEAKIDNTALDLTTEGKKVGSSYYYTAWSFSSLATGSSCLELYGDSSTCVIEGTARKLVNQGDTALLNTIEIAQ